MLKQIAGYMPANIIPAVTSFVMVCTPIRACLRRNPLGISLQTLISFLCRHAIALKINRVLFILNPAVGRLGCLPAAFAAAHNHCERLRPVRDVAAGRAWGGPSGVLAMT